MLAQGALSVFLLACAAQVRGHGFVEKVIYNEEETLLYNPWEDQYNDYRELPITPFLLRDNAHVALLLQPAEPTAASMTMALSAM